MQYQFNSAPVASLDDSDVVSNSAARARRSLAGHADTAPLRILLIVESSACGTGRHILDLADLLIQRGHQVYLVHSTLRIDLLFQKRVAQIRGINCLALPMRTAPHPSDLVNLRAIRKFQSEHGPFDIIHGHSSKGGAMARLAAIGTPARAFYTPHGLISLDRGLPWWKYGFYVSIERALAFLTQGIIAVSPEEERAAAAIGISRSKLITIPNGLDNPQLAPRKKARAELGVGDQEIVVGFVGRLVPQKAPDILLKAFASASAEIANARLAIVGDGPMLGPLKTSSIDLGISSKTIFLGERDAREVFSGFDLFALSSRKEGLPYVVLEAMSAGLPVVATDGSGVEILVYPDTNGFVVPTDDVASIAQALCTLMKAPQLLARFGAASRMLAGRFTTEAMIESTLRFYRSKGRILPESSASPYIRSF